MNAMKLAMPMLVAALAYGPAQGLAVPILGGDLASFAILGGGGVTINGTGSVITGSIGAFPTTSITGVIPTNFNISGGTVQSGGGVASNAQSQLTTAINALTGTAPGTPETALGGLTLGPGVYTSVAAMNLTGTLTLNGLGDPNAFWVFLVGSALTTASSSVVNVINTGAGAGLFWVMGQSASLGSNSIFEGNILANQSITLNTNVTIGCGRVLTQVASVTLAGTDTISTGCAGTGEEGSNGLSGSGLSVVGGVIQDTTGTVVSVPGRVLPEPGTLMLFGFGLAGLFASRKKLFPIA